LLPADVDSVYSIAAGDVVWMLADEHIAPATLDAQHDIVCGVPAVLNRDIDLFRAFLLKVEELPAAPLPKTRYKNLPR